MRGVSTPRLFIGVVAAVALALLIGCGSTSTPTSPIVARASSIARVDLWRASLVPIADDAINYAVRFRASERSGLSDAVIKTVLVTTPYSRHTFDDACWGRTIRIGAGDTQDAFDDGWSSLGSCAPRALPVAGVTVTVTFVDDAGTTGTATASVPSP